jgi:hypothetical protein
VYGNVIRISPPMNIASTDVDQFIELLDHSLSACRATASGKPGKSARDRYQHREHVDVKRHCSRAGGLGGRRSH